LLFILLGGAGIVQRIPYPSLPKHRVQSGIGLLLIGTWFMLIAGTWDSTGLLFVGIIIQVFGSGWTFQASMLLSGNMAKKSDRSRVISTFYVAAYLGMIFPTVGVGFLSIVWKLVPALMTLGGLETILGVFIIVKARSLSLS
jgi:hypothetical protein